MNIFTRKKLKCEARDFRKKYVLALIENGFQSLSDDPFVPLDDALLVSQYICTGIVSRTLEETHLSKRDTSGDSLEMLMMRIRNSFPPDSRKK
ncbi:MAG: hypothetical protein LBQ74_09755 [Prevotella sp.]|jgi:hypothetical protein|nr:hypothetical protein [Prevotella sp.]